MADEMQIMDTMNFTCNISLANPTNFTFEDCSSTPVAGATIISPLIMFMLGVVGNVVAICTIHISKKTARNSKFYILISGLAWTDLLGIVLTTPSVISAYINGRKWVGGEAHCFYQGFAMTCAGLSTTLIICAISIERFLALKCVFFYSSRCSHGTTRCVIAVLWIGVIWFGLLPVFGFGQYELQYPGTWCFLDFHSHGDLVNIYAYIYASFNLVLIFIMIMCNGYVVITLYSLRRRKELHLQNCKRDSMLMSQQSDWTTMGSKNVRKKHSTVDTQMIVLMCAITTTFVICWAPLMIQIIVTMATNKPNYLWDLTAIRLASLNQLLDPWLYILLRKSVFVKIKRSIGKIWKRLFCCCKSNNAEKPEEMVNILAVEVKRDTVNDGNDDPNRQLHVLNSVDNNIPDVSNVSPKSGKSVSPLPDVTQTGLRRGERSGSITENIINNNNNNNNTNNTRQQYVCRLEIGKDRGIKDVGSVYIKVLFLTDECCDRYGIDGNRVRSTHGLSCVRDMSEDTTDQDQTVHTMDESKCLLRTVLPSPWSYSDEEHMPMSRGSDNKSLRRTKSNT